MGQTSRRALLKGAIGALPLLAAPRMSFAQASDDPAAGRSLVFEDDFAVLDTAVWNAGRKATTFDSGFYGRSAFARLTGEEGFNPYAIVDDPAAGNGKALQVSAKYIGRPMNVPGYYGNDLPESQWISGNIQTARPDGSITRGWRNGYFEARMQVARHPLGWSAFWLMNGRSILFPKTSIEVDAMEHKGWELDQYGVYLHEWGKPGEHHEGIGVHPGVNLTEAYYRYGVLIDGALCALYFERRPVLDPATRRPVRWTIGRSQEMDADRDIFWPLLTLALRSDVTYPAPLLPEDRLTHMRVDYFRVYA